MTNSYVKVAKLKALAGHRLWLKFSNGDEGIRDFADILLDAGPMIAPLSDEALFQRAFLSMGVPTWPNGLQLDANNLHMELHAANALTVPAAAE